jgi:hypothetical protein
MKTLWAMRGLRWSYAAFIAFASAKTFLNPEFTGHGAAAVRVLAGAEFFAALVFAFGVFDLATCAVLLVVYALATLLSTAHGDVPLRFLYYAATALALVQFGREPRTA